MCNAYTNMYSQSDLALVVGLPLSLPSLFYRHPFSKAPHRRILARIISVLPESALHQPFSLFVLLFLPSKIPKSCPKLVLGQAKQWAVAFTACLLPQAGVYEHLMYVLGRTYTREPSDRYVGFRALLAKETVFWKSGAYDTKKTWSCWEFLMSFMLWNWIQLKLIRLLWNNTGREKNIFFESRHLKVEYTQNTQKVVLRWNVTLISQVRGKEQWFAAE